MSDSIVDRLRSNFHLLILPNRAAETTADQRHHVGRHAKYVRVGGQRDVDGPPVGIELLLEIAQAFEIVELPSVAIDERAEACAELGAAAGVKTR